MTAPRARIQKIKSALRNLEVDAILVTDKINVTYLTGFSGDSSYLLVTRTKVMLLSDSRYAIQIQEQCPEIEADIRTAKTALLGRVSTVVKQFKVKTLAIEADSMTKSFFESLDEVLKTTTLVGTTSIVLDLRAIKDKQEIETIRRSIRIAERAFEVIRADLRGEQSELEIAHNLEHTIRKFGGSRCSFDPIVGVGPRGALPHGQPSGMKIREHPFVLIDWGAQFRGYASDLTRILVTGKISAKLQKIYHIVLRAQLAAIKRIRPGVRLVEIDRVARKIIEDAGHSKHFGHGLGHGFGLQIHEQPRMSPASSGTIQSGMVVTVEPGIYLPGWGGVRIEDDILVTDDGHEVMSGITKNLDECVVDCI